MHFGRATGLNFGSTPVSWRDLVCIVCHPVAVLAHNPRFEMHFGRATGLNFWAHTCFVSRPIVETAGGWATGAWSKVVQKHYSRRTPSETCSVFRLELTRVCRDLKWQL